MEWRLLSPSLVLAFWHLWCLRRPCGHHQPSRSCDRGRGLAVRGGATDSAAAAAQPVRTCRTISCSALDHPVRHSTLLVIGHPPTLSTRAAAPSGPPAFCGCRLGGWSTRTAPGGRPAHPAPSTTSESTSRAARSGVLACLLLRPAHPPRSLPCCAALLCSGKFTHLFTCTVSLLPPPPLHQTPLFMEPDIF